VALCFLFAEVRFLFGFVFLICKGEIFMWIWDLDQFAELGIFASAIQR
jgi:hypothetical protein